MAVFAGAFFLWIKLITQRTKRSYKEHRELLKSSTTKTKVSIPFRLVVLDPSRLRFFIRSVERFSIVIHALLHTMPWIKEVLMAVIMASNILAMPSPQRRSAGGDENNLEGPVDPTKCPGGDWCGESELI